MKMTSLSIHIIIIGNDGYSGDVQSFFVTIERQTHIRRFHRILHTQTRERAIMFALSKGRTIDPRKSNSPTHLTLTKQGAYWDLMG